MLETGLHHKPYIDGLRAVAVLAVILFHIEPGVFSGGYLGVDMFFVISGFVISQSLYKDYCQKGNIDIIQFYKKRFKRLYPALLVMVAGTTVGYIFFGFLWDTNLFIKSSIFSVLAVSNFYFLKQGDDYFAQDLINPLLHTWSLGVEEQFYLVYPLLLAFGLWSINKNKLPLRSLAWIIGLISVALYFIFATGEGGTFSNFYFPTARFWELGAGCALFFFIQNIKSVNNARFVMALSAGILFLAVTMHQFIDNLYIETFLTVIGSIGIIYAGSARVPSAIFYMLEHNITVFIGKISYSLYLWHLPVIYFANLYLTGLVFYGVAILVMILFALLSYYFVEKPLRYSDVLDKSMKHFPAAGLAAASFLLVITVSLGVSDIKKTLNAGLNDLDSKLGRVNYVEANFSLGQRIEPNYAVNGNNVAENCTADIMSKDQYLLNEKCLKHANEKGIIFLNGDSHAMHFVPALDGSQIISNFYFREFPRSFITDAQLSDDRESAKSIVMNERMREIEMLSQSYSEVYYVMSLFLDQEEYDPADIEKNLNEFINLQDSDTHIIFISPTPVFSTGPESCVILDKFCVLNKTADLKRIASIAAIYETLEVKFKNVHIYDPYAAVCPSAQCLIYDRDRDFLLYRDDDHLSVEGSKSISPHFDMWFKEEFGLR